MGWLLARAYDGLMRSVERAGLTAWRAELLSRARGTVLEIGAGTGASVPHLPADVRLVLIEPDPHMVRRLKARVDRGRSGGASVLIASCDHLPFSDASFDTVVSTLVLCSVEDPAQCLGEIRRVLRPGGRLLFLEHVAAHEGSSRLRWQRRLEPLWKRMMGNCHLTRTTDESIRAAGFTVDELTRESMRKAAPWVRPTVRGSARPT